ncbi:hypothetical protein Ahy_B01g052847 [Arachis hypogaea]|uniref:Uncharacterized protein n=1 Tax=Arachis hypogaea TaxID=3818 RepID=A0A445AQG8_ARAHY|nr:hypothetical protein Ahy_B01g052847 [Arachis hypogaea]
MARFYLIHIKVQFVLVFSDFVQFQITHVTDEANMQGMLSSYHQTRAQASIIELYVEFEKIDDEPNIEWMGYNTKSDEELEGNYQIIGVVKNVKDDTMVEGDMTDIANALVGQHSFEEPSFMCTLNFDAMHALKFFEYVNIAPVVAADSEFVVRMEFDSREVVIGTIKEYTIQRGVDYRVYESEPTIFYAKCEASYEALSTSFVAMVAKEPSIAVEWIEFLVAISLPVVRTNIGLEIVYITRFRPLENLTTWFVHQGPRLVPNSHLKRVTKGRPKKSCFLNEMDMHDFRGPKHCRLCKGEGHS